MKRVCIIICIIALYSQQGCLIISITCLTSYSDKAVDSLGADAHMQMSHISYFEKLGT